MFLAPNIFAKEEKAGGLSRAFLFFEGLLN